jgi:hypothetical protein
MKDRRCYNVLLVSWVNINAIGKDCKIPRPTKADKAKIGKWKSHIEYSTDKHVIKIDPESSNAQCFNHFEWKNSTEFIVAGTGLISYYDIINNSISNGLKLDQPLNCFNYASASDLELLFCENSQIHVYLRGIFRGKLSQSFSSTVTDTVVSNTSRCVFYTDRHFYFMDACGDIYSYDALDLIRQIVIEVYEYHGIKLATGLRCFCYDSSMNRLFFAYKKGDLVHRGKSGIARLPTDERVTAMQAACGILAVCTIQDKNNMTVWNGSEGVPITLTYYIYRQKTMKCIVPRLSKTNTKYLTNFIDNIQILTVKQGLLIIAKPNYKFCDILLLTNCKLTMLCIDKSLSSNCYWTMVAKHDKNNDNVSVWLGSRYGIHKLKFSLN